MYVGLKLLATGIMYAEKKSVCIRMTLGREAGSNACMGPLLIKKLDIAMLIFLFRKFKDLPQIVGLFYLEIELAYNKCSDKCE